jgi:hypothetical protein
MCTKTYKQCNGSLGMEIPFLGAKPEKKRKKWTKMVNKLFLIFYMYKCSFLICSEFNELL